MLKPKRGLLKAKVEEDKILTYTAKARTMYADHGRNLLYGVAAIVAIFVVMMFLRWSGSGAENEAAFDELLIRDAYSRGQMEEAMIKAEEVIADYSGTTSAAVALSVKGKIHEHRGEFELAIQAYEQLISEHADKPYLGFGGYFSLGIVHHGQGDLEQAAHYYQMAAQKYPDHFNAPVSLVEAGRAYKKVNRYDEAKKMFNLAMTKYPKSRVANSARDGLAEIVFMP